MNMKTVGIIGGIGPESTIEYYRFIIEGYRERITDGSYPSIVINSIDLSKLVAWMEADQLAEVADYLVAAIEKLAAAKVDFIAIAANTPHIVFDQVRERSPLPMVSIVEATRNKASALGLRRLALLGTGFTMRSTFYQNVFALASLRELAFSARDISRKGAEPQRKPQSKKLLKGIDTTGAA